MYKTVKANEPYENQTNMSGFEMVKKHLQVEWYPEMDALPNI